MKQRTGNAIMNTNICGLHYLHIGEEGSVTS